MNKSLKVLAFGIVVVMSASAVNAHVADEGTLDSAYAGMSDTVKLTAAQMKTTRETRIMADATGDIVVDLSVVLSKTSSPDDLRESLKHTWMWRITSAASRKLWKLS